MDAVDVERELGPAMSGALARKGYTQLTAVQQAVLDPSLAGRDLRITSQTGSGKTLAIGFALREWLREPSDGAQRAVAAPRAMVISPTRELARQIQAELAWLYADCGTRVVAITGGGSFRDERRELGRNPALVVGTPGRLLDHFRRGSIDGKALSAVVLDEADRLLDMGFREDLDAILAFAAEGRRTHLVSATFPSGVRALADRVQKGPAHVQGTQLGAANVDIDHVIHVIDPKQKLDAIVNLLLANPGEQCLVFARTRADVATLAQALVEAKIAATALSGELDQSARNRALSAFKQGRQSVLVATDVAARGIDVQDVTRVIHAEPPTSADAYTHRSGRTGRAGRKGTSHMLITPAALVPATRLLRGAKIPHRFEPIPTAQTIRKATDERLFAELNAEPAEGEGEALASPSAVRARALAQRLLASGQAERVLARLLESRYADIAEPREVRALEAHARPGDRGRGERDRGARDMRDTRGGPTRGGDRRPPMADRARSDRGGPQRDRDRAVPDGGSANYVPFRVTWGGRHGADPRRLMAIACRRGQIRGTDVGAIRVEAEHSIVEVASEVARSFATHAAKPDPRDRRVKILPMEDARDGGEPRQGREPLKRRK